MNEPYGTYDRIIAPIEAQMIRSIWQIVRNRQDAEDTMQNALLAIWKRWDRICRHPNPQALALKFCIDAAYDQLRRRLRRRCENESSVPSIELADRSPTPSEAAEASEQYLAVVAAIGRMPRQQATAILLRIVQGQSYSDIASAMGCGEATARKHVARGREKLRSGLSPFLQHDLKASTAK
jgi:RNA polymerase sigma-70 factor (ECF subfamily)